MLNVWLIHNRDNLNGQTTNGLKEEKEGKTVRKRE
jgi:hypothetical protein